MIPALIISLIAFTIVLIKAADYVIISTRRLSRSAKVGAFAISAIILALGTSLPELFVGITSAIEGSPTLSFGTVLGSNITNISVIAGFAALIVGKVGVHGGFIRKDVIIAFIAGILPIFLIIDGKLGRIDGLILLAVYLAFTTSLFKSRFLEIAEGHKKESFFYRFLRKFNHIDGKVTKEFGRLFVGIALLLFSAHYIVKISQILAEIANIPVFLVGLLIVSFGTSLPELVFSLRSLEDGEPSMFFGNLLGSAITNSTLIIGLTALIHPIEVVSISKYATAIAAFVIVFLTFWFFIKSKARLDRWEAGVLILIYLLFVIVELTK